MKTAIVYYSMSGNTAQTNKKITAGPYPDRAGKGISVRGRAKIHLGRDESGHGQQTAAAAVCI
nr:hypothetical protein [uncultured Ruminococcus sp.]